MEEHDADSESLSFIGRIERTKTAEFTSNPTQDIETMLNAIRSHVKKTDVLTNSDTQDRIVEENKANKTGLLDFLTCLDDFLFSKKEDFGSTLEMSEEELDYIYKLKNKVSSLQTQKKQYERKVKELNNLNMLNRFRFKKSMMGMKSQVDSLDHLHSRKPAKLLFDHKKSRKGSNSISELIALADKQIELYEKYSN